MSTVKGPLIRLIWTVAHISVAMAMLRLERLKFSLALPEKKVLQSK